MPEEVDIKVTRELVLPAPPDEVWDALTDPERLKEWFANDVEWDGDELVYRRDAGEERRARPRRGRRGGAPRGERPCARAAPPRLPLARRQGRRDARHVRGRADGGG